MTFEVRDADGNTREVTAPPGAVHGVNLYVGLGMEFLKPRLA